MKLLRCALGEYHHGAGRNSDCLAMLTFGTGIGGAVDAAREGLRGATMLANGERTIAAAQLGNRAGLIGAAIWALERSASCSQAVRRSEPSLHPTSP